MGVILVSKLVSQLDKFNYRIYSIDNGCTNLVVLVSN